MREINENESRGEDTFADHYQEVDENVTGIFPLDQPLPDREMIAWRISVNCNREKHPLVLRSEERRKSMQRRLSKDGVRLKPKKKFKSGLSLPITLAEPDTVHISILESSRER